MGGRISMPVDIFQILALAWDHPLIAGVLMLMFTPPFFPVLVFFSPLLISTTLCAVLLISVGQQIEDASKREREVAGWNARGAADGDVPAARERTPRRRRVPGEDNWLDWVKGGLETGSMWGQTESSLFIEDVKEEGLLADFRVDEGGIDMKEEEFREQIEAFREFENRNLGERSFSFRTGAAVAATIDALESRDGDSSMRIVPFQDATTPVQSSSSPQIPPMFLYTLKTGGTGAAPDNAVANFAEAVSAGQRPGHRQRQHQQQSGEQQQKTLLSFGSGFFSGSFREQENYNQLLPQSQQQKSLLSFGSGFLAGSVEEPKKDNERQHHPHPQQQQPKQLLSLGSGFFPGSSAEPTRDNHRQQQQLPKQLLSLGSGFFPGTSVEPMKDNPRQQQQRELVPFGSAFFEGRFEEPESVHHHQHHELSTSPEMHVSSVEPTNSKSVAKSSSSSQNPIKSSYTDNRESDYRRRSIFDFGGERVVDNRESKPRHSQERSRSVTRNASLIPGNAVIYTAEPPPVDTKQLQRRNSLSNRERRESSTASTREKSKHSMAARNAPVVEKENSISGNWMTTAAR